MHNAQSIGAPECISQKLTKPKLPVWYAGVALERTSKYTRTARKLPVRASFRRVDSLSLGSWMQLQAAPLVPLTVGLPSSRPPSMLARLTEALGAQLRAAVVKLVGQV